MEGGRRKRKLQQHNNDKEEHKEDKEEEDENLKLFFALIQSTKSMRDRIKSIESAHHQHKSKGVWNPKFQPEDFMEDCGDKKSNTTPQFSASCSTTKQSSNREEEEPQKDKVEGIKDLDLNLSL